MIGLISIDYLSNRLRINGVVLLVRADEAAVHHRILVVNLNEVTPLGALTQCRDHLWNTLFDKNDILNIDYQTSQRTIQRKNAISDV
jgi:hypothetical protein